MGFKAEIWAWRLGGGVWRRSRRRRIRNFPICESIGHRPLQGRCPAPLTTIITYSSRAQIPLTIWCFCHYYFWWARYVKSRTRDSTPWVTLPCRPSITFLNSKRFFFFFALLFRPNHPQLNLCVRPCSVRLCEIGRREHGRLIHKIVLKLKAYALHSHFLFISYVVLKFHPVASIHRFSRKIGD